MNIVRFNPWRELDELASVRRAAGWVPPVDVWETSADYRIELEIPAMAAEDVDIHLEQGLLIVSGERKRPDLAEGESGEAQNVVRHRSERRYGAFSRRFRLPEAADQDAISASARDGVLHVVIGKRAENRPRRIEIKAA